MEAEGKEGMEAASERERERSGAKAAWRWVSG